MSRVAINTGSVANDGTGDSLRIAGGIINDNFAEIYNQFGDGSSLTPTWDKSAAGINTTSNVGIGTTNPRFALEVGAVGSSGTSLFVNGNARVTGILTVGSSSIILDGNTNKILVGSGISFDGNTGIISATAFYAGGSIISGGGGGGGLNYWLSGATGITTTANVGVATNSAPSALTVGGNSLFTGIATFRNNVTLANLTSSSNTLRFGSNLYLDQSTDDVLTFQINSGTDGSGTDSSFVFRTTEPGVSPIPDQAYDALRIYSGGDYWNRLVRVYTNFHADNNAFVGGDLQVGAASTLIGAGSTLGSFKVGAGGTVITTTSTGLVGIGTSVPNSNLHVVGVSTFNGDVYIDDQLYVNGIEIIGGGGGGVSIGDDITTRNLKATGISTLGITTATDVVSQQLEVSGITTTNSLYIDSFQVVSSGRELQNIASLDATTTSTIESAIANAPNSFTNLQVTGVSTLGITSASDLTSQQLKVTGISTFNNNIFVGSGITIRSSSGIISATTFYGDLVGDVSGSITDATNLTGGYANASQIYVTGIATITDGRIQADASSNLRFGNLDIGSGSAGKNIAIGDQVLSSLNGGQGRNIALGELSYYNTTTGDYNIGIGARSGQEVTTGSYNVIIGSYDGFNDDLDIRTTDNNIVISDGEGNIRQYINSTGQVGINTTNLTSTLTVNGSLSATTLFGTLNSSNLQGALPALDGSALVGIVAAGTGVEVRDNDTPVGTAATINFGTNIDVTFASGIATVSGASSVSEATTAYGLSGTPNIYAGFTTVSYLRAGNVTDIDSATIVGYSPMSGGNIAMNSKNLQLAANGIDNGSRGNIIFYRKQSFGNQSEIATLYSDTGNLSIDGSLTSLSNSENSFSGNIKVGTAITLSNSGHINATGVVTATSFSGSGSGLTNIPAGQLTGALPAIDGSALTGVVAAGTGIEVEDDGSLVGTAGTVNFGTGIDVSPVSAGVVTVTSSGGSLQSRTTVIGFTTSIAINGIGNTDITGFKAYALMKVGLSTAGWLRLYTDSTSRLNDVSRSVGEDPAPGSGVIAEVVTTGVSTTQIISPFVMGGNLDNPADTTIYAAITNLSGSTQSINANLTILQLEA